MILDSNPLPFLTLARHAAADIAAHRLVTVAGDHPTPGGLALGVSRCATPAGARGLLDLLGIVPVETAGAFGTDAPLMAAASGKVIAHDGGGTHHAIGRSCSPSAQAGDLAFVFLVPASGLAVSAP